MMGAIYDQVADTSSDIFTIKNVQTHKRKMTIALGVFAIAIIFWATRSQDYAKQYEQAVISFNEVKDSMVGKLKENQKVISIFYDIVC